MENKSVERITLKVNGAEEKEKDIVEFISNQRNVNGAIKFVIKQYIAVNGTGTVHIPRNNVLPSQKEIEDSLLRYLYRQGKIDVTVQDCYDHIYKDFKLTSAQVDMKSAATGESVINKRVRFAILALKKKGYIKQVCRGTVTIAEFVLDNFKEEHLDRLESIIEANYMNSLIKKENL